MKKYAGKHQNEKKIIFCRISKQRVKGMLAAGMAVVMAVTGIMGAESHEKVWQTVRAEDEQTEVSITSYIEQGATEKNVQITISTAEELRLFAQYVNEGKDTADRTFCLKNDITLSTLTFRYDSTAERTGIYEDQTCIAAVDRDGNFYKTLTAVRQTYWTKCLDEKDVWYPAGDENHPFLGCFQMNGHTVRGMMAVTDETNQGLFGVIGDGGIVQNGRIEASLAAGETAAGGIAGINRGTVKESRCQDTIVMSNGCVGGVTGTNVGSIVQVTVENAIVAGKSSTMISDRDKMEVACGAGGITGYQKEGKILECALQGASSSIVNGGGGIFGHMAGGSIENCTNYSDLDSLGTNMGGIGEYIFSGEIVSCRNYGNITYNDRNEGQINLAGIVAGSLCSIYNDILINACINDGMIMILQKKREGGMSSVGGIIGRMGGGMIGNCGNTGTVGILMDGEDSEDGDRGLLLQVGGIVGGSDGSSGIRNCYNTGGILGDIGYTGGIVGRKNAIDLRSCYTIGKISQKLGTGQITGFTGGGEIIDCFYLEGDNTSLYSETIGGGENILNAHGITEEEVENSLADELNRCVSYYGNDYFQQKCPLRMWCKGAGNYPVLSEEEIVMSNETRPPETTRTPVPSKAPVSSEIPDTSSLPDASAVPDISSMPDVSKAPDYSDIAETPVPSRNPENSEESGGTMELSRLKKETSLSLVESSQIAKVKKLVVSSAKDGKLRITWKASAQNLCYGIYRREGGKGSYKKLAVISGKTTWLDKKTQRGKKYRYQIFACRRENNTLLRSGVTESKWIETAHYSAPKITYKTENADGKRYLKLTLHQYRGDHIDIVLRKNGKEQVIKLHSISKYHGVFRFSYTRTGDFMYCKVRTWENRSGKKRVSEYTDMKKIKL